MNKVWLKSYPQGVPVNIDPSKYSSLVHLMEESFQAYQSRKAYVCMGTYLTYGELEEASRYLGAWLQQSGLKKGARVAIMMPNILQYPIAVSAALRAGFTVVNVNPLYTPRELEHQLKDSGAEAIIVLENFANTLEKVITRTQIKHVLVASMGELLGAVKGRAVNFVVRKVKKMVPTFNLPGSITFRQALVAGAKSKLTPVDLGHEDIAFLQYTGGTTGLSKGAVLTHKNIIANVLQNDAWASPAFQQDLNKGGLATVCALPLYHILALTACMLMGFRWGAMNILIPNPRDIDGFVKTLGKHEFHFFPGVNTLYNALLNHKHFASIDFSALRVSLGGGMAVQEVVGKRWLETTGTPILEGYGLSETSPTATLNPTTQKSFSGNIGLPIPSTDIAILGENDQMQPLGQAGEIAIRGPQVMRGYWNLPHETQQVMTKDGFFKSGDIGVMDEQGYVKIVDRKKDMILVSGFNVFPNEVEAVVSACPGVLECACIGIPDANSGEAVKLYVVRKDSSVTKEQLMAFCKAQLTGYKKPKVIEFRQELPKSNVGKILRRELREEHQVA